MPLLLANFRRRGSYRVLGRGRSRACIWRKTWIPSRRRTGGGRRDDNFSVEDPVRSFDEWVRLLSTQSSEVVCFHGPEHDTAKLPQASKLGLYSNALNIVIADPITAFVGVRSLDVGVSDNGPLSRFLLEPGTNFVVAPESGLHGERPRVNSLVSYRVNVSFCRVVKQPPTSVGGQSENKFSLGKPRPIHMSTASVTLKALLLF